MNKERCLVLSNDGCLDLRFLTAFGVSVKEGEGSIGMFGTGLKYALAILARHGAVTKIVIDGHVWNLTTTAETIRDKEFSMVCISDEAGDVTRLGFTTHLGHHWELWQAFRELYSNMLDEEGGSAYVGRHCLDVSSDEELVDLAQGRTVIAVFDPNMIELYESRDRVFLNTDFQPLYKGCLIEFYQDCSYHAFYRGIRAADLQKPSLFTYNLMEGTLTEDRTIKYPHIITHHAAHAIAQNVKDEALIEKFLKAPEGYVEHQESAFSSVSDPSEEFLRVVERNFHDVTKGFNQSARQLYERLNHRRIDKTMAVDLSPVQKKMLERSVVFLNEVGISFDYDIVVVESLGNGVLGMAKDETIFLTRAVFEHGTKYVAGTIFEEVTHLKTGYADCTRELQDYLIDRMMSLCEDIRGEPL